MKIISYNVHGWYSDEGRHNLDEIVKLYWELQPDILCMQEVTGHGLTKFLELTGIKHSLRWGGTAILSNLEMEDWSKGIMDGNDLKLHNGFIIAKFCVPESGGGSGTPFYVTCLHLDHRVEPTRMKELGVLETRLAPLFKENAPQVWLGDYNSLTEEDYSPEEWAEIARVRKNNSWESPKTQVTSRMRELGFEDSWAKIGRPKPYSTCRFQTHIDYVFTNKPFQDLYKLTSVLHHSSQASDHSPVIAEFGKGSA